MTHPVIRRFGTCSKDCYGACVFESIWDDSRIEHKLLQAIPLKSHPFTQGTFCAKMAHRERLLYNPKRLKHALLRKGPKGSSGFQEIPLEQAMERVVTKIQETIQLVGGPAILSASYSGNTGLISNYAPMRFFNALGASRTIGGICNEGGIAGLTQLFGTYSITNPFQLANPATRLIVVWGCNLTTTNNHATMIIRDAQQRGAKLIVIDPRLTNIAKMADFFVNPNPRSDEILAFLIASKIIQRGRVDQNFVTRYTANFQGILEKLKEITPTIEFKMLESCGIKDSTVDTMVDLLIENEKHTMFNIGYGVQKYPRGGRFVQAIALLQIILGNIGSPGTGIIYSQSAFNHPHSHPLINYLTQAAQLPKYNEIQLISLADALATGKYKVLFIYNFNPVTSLPHQTRLRELLSSEDLFVIQIDLFENETSAYADLVLPTKFDLETDDLYSGFYLPGLSVNEAGPCPYPDCYSNWEIFQGLHHILTKQDKIENAVFQPSQLELYQDCQKLLPPEMGASIHANGYALFLGVDEIPFKNCLFPTANGKIQLQNIFLPSSWQEFLAQKESMQGTFDLLTPAHESFIHSQLGVLHPQAWKDYDCVFLNPEDMDAMSVSPHDLVHVANVFCSAMYKAMPDPTLKRNVAVIYSGPSSPSYSHLNANLFTPPDPEEMGKSGSYNAGKITILKV